MLRGRTAAWMALAIGGTLLAFWHVQASSAAAASPGPPAPVARRFRSHTQRAPGPDERAPEPEQPLVAAAAPPVPVPAAAPPTPRPAVAESADPRPARRHSGAPARLLDCHRVPAEHAKDWMYRGMLIVNSMGGVGTSTFFTGMYRAAQDAGYVLVHSQ